MRAETGYKPRGPGSRITTLKHYNEPCLLCYIIRYRLRADYPLWIISRYPQYFRGSPNCLNIFYNQEEKNELGIEENV